MTSENNLEEETALWTGIERVGVTPEICKSQISQCENVKIVERGTEHDYGCEDRSNYKRQVHLHLEILKQTALYLDVS